MIDTDALSEALTLPIIKIKGVEYVGRIPSHPVALRLGYKMVKVDELSEEDTLGLYREICETAGWPVDLVLALPQPVMMAAIRSFFKCLRQSVNEPQAPQVAENSESTNGSKS